ncbi:hypothetical protein PCE1_003002 [Barthelona sp. PCE]
MIVTTPSNGLDLLKSQNMMLEPCSVGDIRELTSMSAKQTNALHKYKCQHYDDGYLYQCINSDHYYVCKNSHWYAKDQEVMFFELINGEFKFFKTLSFTSICHVLVEHFITPDLAFGKFRYDYGLFNVTESMDLTPEFFFSEDKVYPMGKYFVGSGGAGAKVYSCDTDQLEVVHKRMGIQLKVFPDLFSQSVYVVQQNVNGFFTFIAWYDAGNEVKSIDLLLLFPELRIFKNFNIKTITFWSFSAARKEAVFEVQSMNDHVCCVIADGTVKTYSLAMPKYFSSLKHEFSDEFCALNLFCKRYMVVDEILCSFNSFYPTSNAFFSFTDFQDSFIGCCPSGMVFFEDKTLVILDIKNKTTIFQDLSKGKFECVKQKPTMLRSCGGSSLMLTATNRPEKRLYRYYLDLGNLDEKIPVYLCDLPRMFQKVGATDNGLLYFQQKRESKTCILKHHNWITNESVTLLECKGPNFRLLHHDQNITIVKRAYQEQYVFKKTGTEWEEKYAAPEKVHINPYADEMHFIKQKHNIHVCDNALGGFRCFLSEQLLLFEQGILLVDQKEDMCSWVVSFDDWDNSPHMHYFFKNDELTIYCPAIPQRILYMRLFVVNGAEVVERETYDINLDDYFNSCRFLSLEDIAICDCNEPDFYVENC